MTKNRKVAYNGIKNGKACFVVWGQEDKDASGVFIDGTSEEIYLMFSSVFNHDEQFAHVMLEALSDHFEEKMSLMEMKTVADA